jgi:hypothetical protein
MLRVFFEAHEYLGLFSMVETQPHKARNVPDYEVLARSFVICCSNPARDHNLNHRKLLMGGKWAVELIPLAPKSRTKAYGFSRAVP